MLYIPQDQYGAVFLMKRIPGLGERLAKLFLFQRLGWYFSPVCKILGSVLAVVSESSFFDRFIKVPAVFPQLHLRFVDRNLDQPRGEFRFLTETGKVFEGLQDRSLGDILSVRVILN